MSTEGLFDNFVQNLQLPFFSRKLLYVSQGNGLQDGPQTILTARAENFTVFLSF